jgi:uncharacterized protein (TIGR03437 family)
MKLGTVILFLGVASQVGMAQSPGTFTATGTMITPRADHKATLLPNGKVLITGATEVIAYGPPTASAELFDPFTGTFTATGSMTTARRGHTATLLPDGRVLIAGPDLSAEIYDPSTGTFTPTRGMVSRPYSWLEATTLLQDGTVFIAGQPTAQIYDPATDTFAATSPYAAPAPTVTERATLLADGRVLLTGGTDVAGWTELYDPTNGKFSVAGLLNWWDSVDTATLLTGGKVLFVGSGDDSGLPAGAEIFDPSDGTFTKIGNTSASHEYAASALLPDGTVLITGGQLNGGNGEVISELYAPTSGTFSATGNMITARHEHTATLLPDGTVLIAGGFSLWPYSTASAELYHPAVLVSAPLLFSLSGDGKGQGAIWHAATGQAASPDAPAFAGEILSMYTTSLGDGSVIPPQVAIGGRFAEILFFGNAPGYPGYIQVNVRVPSNVAPGSAVPVHLIYLGRWSNEVTIGVR